MTTTKSAYVFEGSGSAIDDYLKPNTSTDKSRLVPTGNWALFNKSNPKHLLILSLVRQAQWTVANEKHGEVADLNRLSSWLKSERSPVNKPLLKMDAHEIERIIAALGGIVKSIFK